MWTVKRVTLKKATGTLAGYVCHLGGEPLVVMAHRKPVAVLAPVEGMDYESLSVSTNPAFIALIARSRALHAKHGGISTKEMRRRLGIRRKSG